MGMKEKKKAGVNLVGHHPGTDGRPQIPTGVRGTPI